MEHLAGEQGVQPVVFAAGDEHLPPGDAVEDILLPPGVQLAQDVVQQQNRLTIVQVKGIMPVLIHPVYIPIAMSI